MPEDKIPIEQLDETLAELHRDDPAHQMLVDRVRKSMWQNRAALDRLAESERQERDATA